MQAHFLNGLILLPLSKSFVKLRSISKLVKVMKNIILLIMSLGMVGCVSPAGDMLNNQFTTITPQPVGIEGLWTGNNGPYLVTYKFNNDGTGISCASMNGTNILHKFKTNGSDLITQDGLKQTIKEKTSNSLVLKVTYLGSSKEFKYTPDNDLKNASIYCQKELKAL